MAVGVNFNVTGDENVIVILLLLPPVSSTSKSPSASILRLKPEPVTSQVVPLASVPVLVVKNTSVAAAAVCFSTVSSGYQLSQVSNEIL